MIVHEGGIMPCIIENIFCGLYYMVIGRYKDVPSLPSGSPDAHRQFFARSQRLKKMNQKQNM